MTKRVLACFLALLCLLSGSIMAVSAESAGEIKSGLIYFEVPDDWFNRGYEFEYSRVYCHMWRWDVENPDMGNYDSGLCQRTDEWGKVYYDLSAIGGIEEGVDYYVTFSSDIGVSTYEATMNTDCIGDTLYWTGFYKEKGSSIYPVYWRNEASHGCGPALRINDNGKVLGRALPKAESKEEMFSLYLTDYYDKAVEGLYTWEIQYFIDDVISDIGIKKETALKIIENSGKDIAWRYIFTQGDFRFAVKFGKATVIDYIGEDADVVIPDTVKGYPVTIVERGAIGYCNNYKAVKTIYVPASVDEFDLSCCDLNNLESVTVSEENTAYSAVDGILFNKDKTLLICYPQNKAGTEYTIPDTVTVIGEDAFYYNKNLQNINISNSVTEIGKSAFFGSKNLKKVIIPEGVMSMGGYAFAYAEELTSVTIPSTLTVLDEYAFYSCEKLSDVKIHSVITEIYKSAFSGTAYYNDKANWEDGFFYIGDALIGVKYEKEGVVNVKEGTRILAVNSFMYCEKVTEVNLPDSVKIIGASSFRWCTALTKVNIPQGVKEIGFSTFENCQSLTEVKLPSSVTSIAYRAFMYCDSLAEINVPKNVKSIGKDMVTLTAYYENEANWSDGGLYIDNALVKVSDSAKDSFTVKDNTTTIAQDAFNFNYQIKEIIIPDTLKYIHPEAATLCDALTTVRYKGSNVRYKKLIADIGADPFEGKEIIFDMVLENSLGDTNKDGKLNVRDATAIQKYTAKLLPFDEAAIELADFDGDRKVTVKDATAIQKQIAGLIPVGAVFTAEPVNDNQYIAETGDTYYTYDNDGFYDPSYSDRIPDYVITGDNTPNFIILGIVIVLACVACVIIYFKRKDKDDY